MTMMMPPEPRRLRPVDWTEAYEKHRVELREVENAIIAAQREADVQLSPDAAELLLLPFLAVFERGDQVPEHVIQQTIDRTLHLMAKDPDPRDNGDRRSALSVIRAWWRGWCNLPPICRPVEPYE